ncbi:unnamed protein product, partial [Ectocarpus sp. 4 AP-2014]
PHNTGAVTGVTQGVHRAVLDWSTGVIVKLAAALPKHATMAASPNVSTTTTTERHARNARRWLSDPRIWRCFVRSLRGGATQAAEPSTHLPQAASLGVLRAAIFAVRAGAPGSLAAARAAARAGESCSASPQAAEPKNDGMAAAAAAAAAGAGGWAFVAVLTLCGGVIVTAGGGGGRAGGHSSGSMTSIDAAVLDELQPRRADGRLLAAAGPAVPALATVASKRWAGGGAVMKVSLDAYVTFLDEVLRGHEAFCQALPLAGDGAGSGGRSSVGGKEAAAVATAGGGALPSLAEGALTELLRFQVVLQAQQTSPRKVFTTFCSKLMGSLFQALPLEGSTASASSPFKTAAKAVACDALFHEEHLEGYREAFTAAEAAAAAAAAMAALAAGSRVDGEGMGRSRLGALAGAPILLEGFILRLRKVQRGAVDIHEASGAAAAAVAMGGKRSRSSGGSGGGSGSGSSASPASQMFRLWSVLNSTLLGSLPSAPTSSPPPPPPSDGTVVLPRLLLLPLLRSSNSMLRLLAEHDVYRINEDWGGLEFDQLRSFSYSLIRLADGCCGAGSVTGGDNSTDGGAPGSMAVSGDGARRREDAPDAPAAAARVLVKPTKEEAAGAGAAAEEFLRTFGSLLGLNHSILHDDLRPVLRMTFEWAATAETAKSAAATATPGTFCGGDAGNGGPPAVLRALAVDFVASLVGTYGRLRQMDHLVRALFGAVSDCPQAAAAMLRRDECAAALGRAFRRLPEGQIASMWGMFAAHLREGWNQSADGGGGGGGGRNDLLAREMDAELFVLFVRNLHVTSSVASAVGALCVSLAEESLRSFGLPLRQAAAAAAAAAAASSPPASKKKKKRKGGERVESEQHGALGDGSGSGGGSGGVPMSEMLLSFRPALDVHGWLLDLDTRCRFWSAVLVSSSTATAAGAGAVVTGAARPQDDGDTLVEEGGDGDETAGTTTAPAPRACVLMPPDGDEADVSLPRIIAAATAALETSNSSSISSSSLKAGTGAHDEEVGVRSRLEKTLQQVAVHRVQQIYARLNGVAALESSGTTAAAERRPTPPSPGTEGEDDDEEGELEEAAPGGAAREEGGEEKLEEEARGLVAYACGACRGSGGGGHGPVVWGDEDGGGRGGGAGWSMMMPYLPVWVGFAEEEQVSLFLEALLSRCAADILDGRGEEESPPLRLLSDASFYEMEAVAKSAPAVILTRVFHTVRRAVGDGRGAGDKKESGAARLPPGFPAVDTIVAAVQALATAATTTANEKEKGRGGAAEGSSSDSPAEVTGGGEAERKGRDKRRQQEEELLEACCLLMMTEWFPSGFLDEEALAAMLMASDALDAVLARSLLSRCGSGGGIAGGGGGKKPADGDVAALLLDDDVPPSRGGVGSPASPASAGPREESLVEALAALRGLSLRLGRSLPPESPLLEGLPQGDALLRVIGPAASVERGDESSRARLLRASACLLPFLAERCVLRGDTKTALKAIVGLGLIKPRPASGGGEAEQRRRKRGHHPRKAAP